MTREIKYNSSLPEAIEQMEAELEDMRTSANREELKDVDSDTAFELGYETSIHDLRRFTGPDPVDLGVIVYTNIEESTNVDD